MYYSADYIEFSEPIQGQFRYNLGTVPCRGYRQKNAGRIEKNEKTGTTDRS
jgi:hypothetical protein